MRLDKILILKLVFCKDGSVIVVNVFFIFDGVLVLILMCESDVDVKGSFKFVCILGYISYVYVFGWFIIVFVFVISMLFEKVFW